LIIEDDDGLLSHEQFYQALFSVLTKVERLISQILMRNKMSVEKLTYSCQLVLLSTPSVVSLLL